MKKAYLKRIVAIGLTVMMVLPMNAIISYAAPEQNLTDSDNMAEPVGGWEPTTAHYIEEDIDIDNSSGELRRGVSTFNYTSDSVFTKGASSVGYNALSSDKQKQYYIKIHQELMSIIDTKANISSRKMNDTNYAYVIAQVDFSNYNISQEEAYQVYLAYDYDHPAFYWISNEVWYSNTSFYICTDAEYSQASERDRIDALVESGVQDYVELASYGENTFDKITIVHDAIVNDVDYAYEDDGSTPESDKWAHSVQGVFDSQKHVVCEGYADTFSLIMNYMGIPNYYIVGTAGSGGAGGGGGHAWNAVYDDTISKYLYMDLTWDDLKTGGYYHKYFGMPVSDFENQHFKYEPSNTGSTWLYEITGDFNDEFAGTYYSRNNHFYDGTDDDEATTFANSLKTRDCRFDKYYSFATRESDSDNRNRVLTELGIVGSYSYYTVTYKGVEYYVPHFELGENEKVNISSATVTLDQDKYAYTGEEVTPVPTVTLNGVTLIEGLNYNVSYNNNTSAGTGTLTITGIGNYEGSCDKTFAIEQGIMPIKDSMVTVNTTSFVYNGEEQTPIVTVKAGDTTLEAETHYNVVYSEDSTNVGNKTATITGIPDNKYEGTVVINYVISPKDISEALVVAENEMTYTGSALMPTVSDVKISDGGASLIPDTDYTISYDNNINVEGNHYIVITGQGNYANVKQVEFSINQADIANCVMTLSQTSFTADGTAKEPTATIVFNGITLVQGTDYDLSYNNNKDKTAENEYATCTATGKGNFTGTKVSNFVLVAQSVADMTIQLSDDSYVYNGSNQTPTVIVKNGNTVLSEGDDNNYTISYSSDSRKDVGTYIITLKGTGKNANEIAIEGETTLSYSITPKPVGSNMITVNDNDLIYDGREKRPDVTVKDTIGKLTSDEDYVVSSYSNNVAAGSDAEVTIEGKGNYKGEATKTFTISPASLSSATITINEAAITYDGTAKTPQITVTLAGGDLTLDRDYSVEYLNNTNAGNATVKITGKGNFKDTKADTFTIAKADTKALTKITKNINKEQSEYSVSVADKIPAAAGTVTGYEIGEGGATVTDGGSVSVSDVAVSSQGLVSATLANGSIGDVITIPVKAIATNYDCTIDIEITLTDKVLPNYTAPTAKSLIYNGNSQQLVTAGNVTNGGQMLYATSENGTYKAEIPTAKDAGTYKVYYKIEETEDTLGIEPQSIDVTIARRTAVVTANNKEKTEKSTDPKLTATVTGLVGNDTINYTLSRQAGESVGTYVITASGSTEQGNYDVQYVTGTFTIKKASGGGSGGSGSGGSGSGGSSGGSGSGGSSGGSGSGGSSGGSGSGGSGGSTDGTDSGNSSQDSNKTDEDSSGEQDSGKTPAIPENNDTPQSVSDYTNPSTGEVIIDKIIVPKTDNAGTTIVRQADGTVTVSDSTLGKATNVSPAVFAEGDTYRLYNPNSGEHFYTKNPQERDALAKVGWSYEKDQTSKTIASTEEGALPVYRVYNPNSGLHHYTTNKNEVVMLKNVGWNYEGISLYAYANNSNKGTPVYRVYCPFPDANGQNQHVYTTSAGETSYLISLGYIDEGIAWSIK